MVRNVILWITWYSELTNFELTTFSCTPELLLCIHFLTKINFIYIYRSFATTLSQQQCHNIVTTAASQHCHNSSVTTTVTTAVSQHCHKSITSHNNIVTTAASQHCHNSSVTTLSQKRHKSQQHCHNSSITTTVSQLKICDFSGETFKDFEVL